MPDIGSNSDGKMRAQAARMGSAGSATKKRTVPS
jgi:hypothetical protein